MQRGHEIKALVKMAQLIDCFSIDKPEWALSELAAACELHPSTARRLLRTSESLGWIAQDPDTRRYRLGMKLFELGHRVGEQLELPRVALPHLHDVVAGTKETAYLSVYSNGEVMYIERVESPHSVRLLSHIGQRLPAHTTGSGKVFLAHLPPAQLEAFLAKPLARFTENTIYDPAALRTELEQVRRQGYATTFEEHDPHTYSIAAPIWGHDGRVVAGLGMSGPLFRLEGGAEHHAQILIKAANKISEKMGAPLSTRASSD